MNKVATLTIVLVLGAGLCAAAPGTNVSFSPAGRPITPGAVVPAEIPGTLSLPSNAVGPVPAVVIGHASGGLMPEGPEADYVAALNAAGIATLVIDMWTPRQVPSGAAAFGGGGGEDHRPRAIGDTLPDAFGALKFLAAHPAIDRKRVGMLGFSWGAMLSVLAMQACWPCNAIWRRTRSGRICVSRRMRATGLFASRSSPVDPPPPP
jgi:hypothetical protein